MSRAGSAASTTAAQHSSPPETAPPDRAVCGARRAPADRLGFSVHPPSQRLHEAGIVRPHLPKPERVTADDAVLHSAPDKRAVESMCGLLQDLTGHRRACCVPNPFRRGLAPSEIDGYDCWFVGARALERSEGKEKRIRHRCEPCSSWAAVLFKAGHLCVAAGRLIYCYLISTSLIFPCFIFASRIKRAWR